MKSETFLINNIERSTRVHINLNQKYINKNLLRLQNLKRKLQNGFNKETKDVLELIEEILKCRKKRNLVN